MSVASAQALHQALPEADLWFWDVDDTVHEVRSEALLDHARPFEDAFKPGKPRRRRDRSRRSTRQRPRTACWCSACMAAGRRTANCRRCAKCAALPSPAPARRRRISPSTRWRPNALPPLPACKAPAGVALEDIDAAFAEYGKLIAKAGARRIELRADLRQRAAGSRRRPQRGQDRGLSDRAVHRGRGSDLRRAGAVGRLADRAAAGRDHPGGRRIRVRLPRQVPRESHAGNLPWPFCSRHHGAVDGSGAEGAPGAVVQRLFPFGLHRCGARGWSTSKPTRCRA